MELVVERRDQLDKTARFRSGDVTVSLSPPIGTDYWSYRVRVGHGQAVVAFPKFMTIGIGFATEDKDWNTNLPWTCDTDEILAHIAKNKDPDGVTDDSAISIDDCRMAIKLIQDAIREDRVADPDWKTR
jgi:hypothetical protein